MPPHERLSKTDWQDITFEFEQENRKSTPTHTTNTNITTNINKIILHVILISINNKCELILNNNNDTIDNNNSILKIKNLNIQIPILIVIPTTVILKSTLLYTTL